MSKKVFISYAHESEELSNKVLEFSNYLRGQGIDSEIDQYEESPMEGWPKWMFKQVQQADFVLVCCSKLFYERANDFSGSGEGLGVKWETSLILQQLYALNTQNTKFIPIIFDNNDQKHIPLPLQPYTYYEVSKSEKKQQLIDRINGTSKSKRPPLGKPSEPEEEAKPLDPKERKSMFFSSIIDIDLWNEAKWKGMAFFSDPGLKDPPIACFLFENEVAGEKIFGALKERFGESDDAEEIRLSFIEDISTTNQGDYKVHFGTARDSVVEKLKKYGLKAEETLLMMVSRIHEMNPPNTPNSLTIFKHSYGHFKKYYITNVVLKKGQLEPRWENLIEKKSVVFRKKSEVITNEHDEDYVVFHENELQT